MAASEVQLSVTRSIRQGRERVFRFMFDPHNFGLWMSGFQSRVPYQPDTDGTPGSKARHTRRHKGMKMVFEETIEAVDMGNGFSIALHSDDLSMWFGYRLHDTADGGTMLTVEARARPHSLFFTTIRGAFATVLERQLNDDLAELAALLDEV